MAGAYITVRARTIQETGNPNNFHLIMGNRVHMTNGGDCWCEPMVEKMEEVDGEIIRLFVHTAGRRIKED